MTGGQRRAPQGLISAWSAAEATVDGEGARGDHRRCVGGQIERRVGDLVRGRVPAQRDHAVEDLGGLCLWQTGRLHLDGVLERGRGRPRVEGVDPILRSATSFAAARMSPTWPCLAATYALICANPMRPTTLDVMITL